MPAIKPISGHTGLQGAMRYFERDGRALAHDFINLDIPSDDGRCAPPDWASPMDELRRLKGNDRAWGGRAARTYKHYVLSPDPKDQIDLPRLRVLATRWARESFGEHQVAIVYHDDNEGHIPHAHVIVNNTNVVTGRRLRDEDPGALNGKLQRIARDMGLSHFDGRLDARHPDTRKGRGRKTRQRVHVGRAEAEIEGRGESSWVADIRARADIARAVAADEREFVAALGALGVNVSENKRGEWVYSLTDAPSRRVGGTRLGTDYQRQDVRRRLRSPRRVWLTDGGRASLEEAAREALALGSLADLDRLARAVRAIEGQRARSLDSLDGEERETASDLGLLPERPEPQRREKKRASTGLYGERDPLSEGLPEAPRIEREGRDAGDAR